MREVFGETEEIYMFKRIIRASASILLGLTLAGSMMVGAANAVLIVFDLNDGNVFNGDSYESGPISFADQFVDDPNPLEIWIEFANLGHLEVSDKMFSPSPIEQLSAITLAA